MKRIIIFLALLAFLCYEVNAQEIESTSNIDDVNLKEINNREYRAFEFEVAVGPLNVLFDKIPMDNYCKIPVTLQFELRYNFANTPIDIGVGRKSTILFPFKLFQGASYILSDYNFKKSKNLKLFTGVCLGYGEIMVGYSPDRVEYDIVQKYTPEGQKNIFVSPRFGVEIKDHFRLSVNGSFTQQYFNSIGFTIGFVLGGGSLH